MVWPMCVWFNPRVLVSDILLDVASRLRFELLAVGGTLERTEGGGAWGTTELSSTKQTGNKSNSVRVYETKKRSRA